MSEREAAQLALEARNKSANPSAFDTIGAFNSYYNPNGSANGTNSVPLGFGTALPANMRADAIGMLSKSKTSTTPTTPKKPGFWGKVFNFMEKAYNLSAQTVSFALTLPESENPLLKDGFNIGNLRSSWDAARQISPGQAWMREVGKPIGGILGGVSSLEKIITGNKESLTDKFLQDHAAFATAKFNIFDEQQRQQAFREQTIGRFSSFATDVVARFVIDPTIIAGKAVKVYRATAYTIKGAKDLEAILAGEKTGFRAKRVKTTVNDFLEKTDGMDAGDLFRVKAIRESSNPAAFADVLADANKIEDKTLRHQTKLDILRWAQGDATAAEKLIKEQELLAAKIGQLQDEVVTAKYFGKSYNPTTKEYTFDFINQGDDYENVVTLAKEYEGQLAEIHKKLSTEAIISPDVVPKFGVIDAIRTGTGSRLTSKPLELFNARSQEFIDVRSGAAGLPMRIMTGFFYKRPKGWIDFTDNQSVQTVDNMLSRVIGISKKQETIYNAKILAKKAELEAATDNKSKKLISAELNSLTKSLEQATFTVEKRNQLFDKYVKAIDASDRASVYQEIEEELFTTVARQFGYTRDDVRKAWAAFSTGRVRSHNLIRERAYTGVVDPKTGAPIGARIQPIVGEEATYIFPLPLNETQLVKQLPTLDIDAMYGMLRKSTRATRFEKGGKVYNAFRGGKQAADELVENLDSLLKFEVLARVGYPIRNVTEGHMRIMTTVGPMAILNAAQSKGKNLITNRFKGASTEDVFNWSDKTKLATKKAELEMMIDNADDPVQIQREIDEIQKMLDGKIKIKDKYGLGLRKIKVGDEVITYEDALGATPERAKYIQEKFIAQASQITDNAFSNSSKRIKNAYETNGDFVVIKGSDANWENAYERVINRQVRNSKITKILLQDKPREQLINEAEDFLLSNVEGRKIMKSLAMGRDARSIAEVNMMNVEGLFPSWISPEFKKIANARNITAKDIKKYLGTDATRRPDVNAAQVSAANGTSAATRLVSNFLDNFYHYMGEVPESALVRNPLFIDLYRKRMASSVQNAIESYPGNSIPPAYLRKLENSARQWARAEMRRTLYDTSERVAAAAYLKYVFPFFGAFADVLEKWGRILLNDPSVIRKLETVYTSPDRAGLTEERDGRTYINIPGEWAKRLSLGISDRPISIPKTSLNLIFQGGAWWNPGAGWFVQLPISSLVKNIPDLERNKLVKEILPYGADGTGWKDLLLQGAAFRKAYAVFDTEDPMRQNLTVLIAAEENAKHDQGLRADVPSAKEIENKVRGILALEVASRLILPFATNVRSPYQFYIDEYHRLRQENPDTAADIFYEKYGDDYYAFTTSLSKNNTGISATIEADKRSRQLSDLIAKNPEFGWFIVGDANAGEFSPSVYQRQRETAVAPGSAIKYRESQDPYEAIKSTNAEKGWIKYNKGMDIIEAARIARGFKSLNSKGTEDLKAAKERFIAGLSQENPDWAKVRGKIDTQKVYNFLKFAQEMASDPRLANRNDMMSIKQYIDGRQYIINLLSRRESQNIDANSNRDLREAWDTFTGQLIDQDITFNRIFTRYLENDDLRKGL